ncbi:MAG: ribonuclease III [Chloroflexota bacterium]
MVAIRLDELETRLGLKFKNQELLRLALVHRSYVNEKSSARQSNERLEFLGDAVLSLVVANYLYEHYPEQPEGELTDLRSALVRRETLNKWAGNFEIGQYLFLGKGEAATGGRSRTLTLASAFEAVLGALFLEQGLEGVQIWLLPQLEKELIEILSEGRHRDYKSLLQEAVQHHYHQAPLYYVAKASGPEHERIFEIEVQVGERVLGRGSGTTKQYAQQAAAKDALSLVQAETELVPSGGDSGSGNRINGKSADCR